MEEIVDLLERELLSACEVRDEESLKRFIKLLVQNAVGRKEYSMETTGIRNEIKTLAEKIETNSEIMREGFAETHRMFTAIQHNMDKRFESMDKRFESLQHNMDKRFESLQHNMDKRFESMQQTMNDRFEAVDKRLGNMFTFMTLGFSLLTVIAVLFKFLA